MDLSLTAEQEMLKAAARRFVQRECPKETLLQIASPDETTPLKVWDRLAGTGWLGILIPQEYGGEGGSFTDAGALFEELGRGPVPGPHLSSGVLGALSILEGGTEEQKREWLPRIAGGEMRMVPAVTEADYGWHEGDVRMTARPDGDNYRLDGVKAYVFDGGTASHYLCAVRSNAGNEVGLAVVPADVPGVRARELPGFAWNTSEVGFEDVETSPESVLGGSFSGGWKSLERAIGKAIPVLCAFQVGGCQAVYELSVGLQPHPSPVRDAHRPVPAGAGPRHQPGEPTGRGALDGLRGVVEAGHGKGLRRQRPPGQSGGQRGLLSSLQLRPRGPRRGGEHDRVRVDAAHRRVADALPLPGGPQVPPAEVGGRSWGCRGIRLHTNPFLIGGGSARPPGRGTEYRAPAVVSTTAAYPLMCNIQRTRQSWI